MVAGALIAAMNCLFFMACSSRPEQCLDGPALIHGLVTMRDIGKRNRRIEDLSGIDEGLSRAWLVSRRGALRLSVSHSGEHIASLDKSD